jgi:hypothetical protein
MKKQKRENKLEVACRCGHVQLTAAMCAFKCEKCRGFNYVDQALQRIGKPAEFLEGIRGKLGGYCSDCGMMKIKGEKPCVRCGGTGLAKNAPTPAGNIVAVSLLGHRPQCVGRLF